MQRLRIVLCMHMNRMHNRPIDQFDTYLAPAGEFNSKRDCVGAGECRGVLCDA